MEERSAPLRPGQVFLLTGLAMLAFAGNSLLCRWALKQTAIDPASFTLIRILSGTVVLCLVVKTRHDRRIGAGNWPSAMALFAYAAAFSFAYVSLPAGTGALLLFGAVQATMILWGIRHGERMHARQFVGLAVALSGLVALVLPGISAPSCRGAILMISAGIAWGVYSLRGKGVADPRSTTTGNFLRAVPFAAVLNAFFFAHAQIDFPGLSYAILSGAIASALGYVIWYTVLPALKGTTAATVQLSVPVLAASAGILVLGEPLTIRFVLTSIGVLGGIALVVTGWPPGASSLRRAGSNQPEVPP